MISYYGKVACEAELLRRIILLFPISHFLDKRGNKNFLQSLRSSFLFEVQQIQKTLLFQKRTTLVNIEDLGLPPKPLPKTQLSNKCRV